MKRGLESLDSISSATGPLVWFLGVAIVILALLGGITMVRTTTVNPEQICVAHGGSYSHKDDSRDLKDAKSGNHTDMGHTITDTCTIRGK